MSIIKKASVLLLWILLIFWSFFVSGDILSFEENWISQNIITSTEAQANQTNQTSTTKNENSTKKGKTNTWSLNEINEWLNTLISAINIIIGLLTVILTPLIMLSSWLMSPDWSSWDLFNLRWPMHNLWKIISNIIYFIYAVLLLVVALGTIFNNKTYNQKVMLPKLLLWFMLVPFTWWFVQYTISLSTNVTASILSIPKETIDALESRKNWWEAEWYKKPIIPKKITLESFVSWEKEKIKCDETPWQCESVYWVIKSWWWMYGSMLVYAYGIFKIHNLKDIKNTGEVDVIKNLSWLVTNGIISSIMFIVFWLLMVALLSMLFIRAFWLWIYAIFSPLFTLFFVVWENKWFDKFNIKEFIWAAFVPAIVWFVLSLWIIVISAIETAFVQTSEKSAQTCNIIEWSTDATKVLTLMWNPENVICTGTREIKWKNWEKEWVLGIKFGWITFEHIGSWEPGKWSSEFMSIFGTMIIQFIALWFIWVAFISGSKKSSIMNTVIAPFERITGKASEIWKSLASSTPLPIFGNIKWVEKWLYKINSGLQARSEYIAEHSDFAKLVGVEQKSKETIEAENKLRDSITKLGTQLDKNTIEKEKQKEIEDAVKSLDNYNKQSNLSARETWKTIIERFVEIRSSVKEDPEAKQAMYETLFKWKDNVISKERFEQSPEALKIYLNSTLKNGEDLDKLQKLLWLTISSKDGSNKGSDK